MMNNEKWMTSDSQGRKIYSYMKAGHSITPIEALNKFNCFRLGARIGDLKKRGYNIRTRKVKEKDGQLTLFCTEELHDLIEANLRAVKPIFTKYYNKLIYQYVKVSQPS